MSTDRVKQPEKKNKKQERKEGNQSLVFTLFSASRCAPALNSDSVQHTNKSFEEHRGLFICSKSSTYIHTHPHIREHIDTKRRRRRIQAACSRIPKRGVFSRSGDALRVVAPALGSCNAAPMSLAKYPHLHLSNLWQRIPPPKRCSPLERHPYTPWG